MKRSWTVLPSRLRVFVFGFYAFSMGLILTLSGALINAIRKPPASSGPL